MNVQEYLESGILELYVLNLLPAAERSAVERDIGRYPELGRELERIELSLEGFASSAAIVPPFHIKNAILNNLENLDKERIMDSNDLPFINKFSDFRNWLRFVKPLIAKPYEPGLTQHILRHTDKIMQALVISSVNIPDELHENVSESFLILEGKCRCTVEGRSFFMETGDFTEIPLYEMHNVEMVSPYVVAVLQHVTI